ncbi:hypothetical protein Golomagni_03325 [Golovinomyces magnicellulatus]|nr:hypothetical protein Golomagni_03325 [Golovinomyces magnicellulatus]
MRYRREIYNLQNLIRKTSIPTTPNIPHNIPNPPCFFRENLPPTTPISSHYRATIRRPSYSAKAKCIRIHLIYKSFCSFESLRYIKIPRPSQIIFYQSSTSGPWTVLLSLSTLLLIFSVIKNITLPNRSQEVDFLPTDEILFKELYGKDNMISGILPGRPETLTPEQEEKLKEFWHVILQISGVLDGSSPAVEKGQSVAKSDVVSSKKPRKKRISIFRKSKDEDSEATPLPNLNETDDKFGQMKVFNEAMANMTPEDLRKSFWSMVKHDNPDALLLRFLRARRWDIEKALVMMVSAMRWRLTEVHVDDDIVFNGELKALEQTSGTDAAEKKLAQDFLDQIRMGKTFLHGTDKNGRPLCIVRVRYHKTGEQSEESLERFTVYVIETARMLLASPVDTASVLFDMSGFSMANMDYAPVKFMIKCFEANYPECLGVVLVHKAPWVFQGIWKIIRGWLDPVVASKVVFTNTVEEMEEYISRSQIIKELGGDEDWEYKYIEPVPGENDKMKDTETRNKLLQEREKIVKEYEQVTLQWLHAKGPDSSAINSRRQDISGSLRNDYWNLDPYVRAKSFYDRTNVINPGGKIQFYPQNTVAAESRNHDAVMQA